MQVRLLGPVDVMAGDTARPLSGLRRKALLAVLALNAGEVVSTDRLVEVVWDGKAPATAANTLQSHASHLRRLLGASDSIAARSPGYVLNLGPDATDVLVADRLIRRGKQSSDHAEVASSLRAALALWRGPALADVAGIAWLDQQADRLEQVRLDAVQALVDARLALGEHVQLVSELERLTRQHQFHEHIYEQLMLALYRSGRQAEALATYQRLRRTLGDELGIDPSPPLKELEAAILRQDPALDGPATVVTLADTRPVVPAAQLPAAIAVFSGRTAEVDRLDRWLADSRDPVIAAPVIAITGTAGVGKTALAVHWAHRVAARFPDGQLYVDLHGFDPADPPTSADRVIRGFLDALGVPVSRIPGSLAEQTALYRSLLAGQRVLVVLDNAATVEQVRPLLPNGPGCAVAVTSRNQLAGLAAVEGAHLLTLDLLTRAEAWDLLTARLGPARTAAEPGATDEIIGHCAGLPLALVIVAARAVVHPTFSLADLARELRDDDTRLDVLDGGDSATQVRGVFSWSYRRLSVEAAGLFRALGLHPGPDVSVDVAASMTGLREASTRSLLAEVTRAGLVSEPAPGRFAVHDLLRVYGAELADAVDGEARRNAYEHRMIEHYLHTAFAAATMVNPHRAPIELDPPRPGVAPTGLADIAQARAWFAQEQCALLAAVRHAARAGLDRQCWQLVWTLVDVLDQRGHWHALGAAVDESLRAARRLGDASAQAHAHRYVAGVHLRLGDYGQADEHLKQALGLFEDLADYEFQAHTYLSLCWLSGAQSHDAEALQAARHAFELFCVIGSKVGQARSLNAIAWYCGRLGDHREALACGERALILVIDLGHPSAEAAVWDSLGAAHHNLGDHDRAAACYVQALRLHTDAGERYYEAVVLAHLGDTHEAAGQLERACDAWQRAGEIFDQLGHREGDDIRSKLCRLAEALPVGVSPCSPRG